MATTTLIENENDVKQSVCSLVAAHCKVFQGKQDGEQQAAATEAEELGAELSVQRHHRVKCPACQCVATVQGTPFGKEHTSGDDGEIILRQAVSPTGFACSACGLKFKGYAQLHAAGLGAQYTRQTT